MMNGNASTCKTYQRNSVVPVISTPPSRTNAKFLRITGEYPAMFVPNVMAQYLRFDVTAASGANPGAAEFQFYGPVPEPAAGGLLAVFAVLGCGRRGRRSLFPR